VASSTEAVGKLKKRLSHFFVGEEDVFNGCDRGRKALERGDRDISFVECYEWSTPTLNEWSPTAQRESP